MQNNGKKMLIVDGNFLLFQSFYASYNPYKPESVLKAKNGISTNGVHVFFNTLFKLIKYIEPSHLFIAFDAKGKTKRHEIYENYKTGRTKAPEIIFEQFKLVKEVLTSMNIKWAEKEGDEADDLIATIATKNDQFHNYIYSKDKDLLQLVNENNSIISTIKDANKFSTYDLITILNFKLLYGIKPEQIPDYKGLAGDSSDNLKGVQGIGEKRAIALLREYETLENIYDCLINVKGKTREYLINDKESAFFCKKLAVLNKDVKLPYSINDLLIELDINAVNILNEYSLYNVLDQYKNNLSSKYKK
ncbi:5'-3' exonuclease [Mycoplasma tauri]|uniref:5'-3' exonuclease n=1 Tax=Mycoplasma tauri TaxID=547987 RepID=A0A953T707_9MOLU|nr:5'-3' exonuclease [Mycoplasma tauri]MBZ4195137.1 5'-3' exonuclease [Mycoplasma tauri]MBZ4218160.1 5'-3' exonuclease [Mycoplasma tauri]